MQPSVTMVVGWVALILLRLACHNGAHAKRDDALLRQDRGLAGLVGDSRPFLQHDVAASHLGAAGVFVGKAHLMPRTVCTPGLSATLRALCWRIACDATLDRCMIALWQVEEVAAVQAAREAVRRARRADRQTAVLRQDVEKKVELLKDKVKELKERAAQSARVQRALAAAARVSSARAATPHWHGVPLAQRRAAGTLPNIALPPGSSRGRQRGRRGRMIRLQRRPAMDHGDEGMGLHKETAATPSGDSLTPVLPPGAPTGSSTVRASGVSAADSAAHAASGLPVLHVGENGGWMTVAAEDSAAVPPGPDMVVVTLCDGGEQILPYASTSKLRTGSGLRLLGVRGVSFPLCATSVRPAMQLRFLVKWVSETEIHADGWIEQQVPEGAGLVRAQLASGHVITLPFAYCQLIVGSGHHILAIHAAKGCTFRRDVAYVSPLAGSPWATRYHQGTMTAGSAAYFRGLRARVRSVSGGGERMEVEGKRFVESLDVGGRVVVQEDTCSLVGEYYQSSIIESSGLGAELVAAGGTSFPANARQVLIPEDPAMSFSVYWRSKDGSRVRVQAPDNGCLHRMGGVVAVERSNGEQALYRFRSAEWHAADDDGPAGLMLVAERGVVLPLDIARVSQSGPVLDGGGAAVSITFVDAKGGYACRVGQALGVGDRVYVDRNYLYTSVPEALHGHAYILTAMGDAGERSRNDFLTFIVDRPAEIYVLYDASARALPQWLLDAFSPVGGAVETNRGPLAIWKAKMIVVGTVTVGANEAFPAQGEKMMFTIVVLPAAAHRPRPPSARVAAAAMASMHYPVVEVSDRGNVMTIMARPTAQFPAASETHPQTLQVQKKDGSLLEAVYVGMEVVDDEALPLLRFRVSPMMSFPAEATGASPAAIYQVVQQSPDGTVMRVDCPNDGRFSPGPGRVKVKMAYGRQADFPYESLQATGGGMELRAPKGLAFPADAVAAAPAALPLADPVVFVSPDQSSLRLIVADSSVYFAAGSAALRVMTFRHGVNDQAGVFHAWNTRSVPRVARMERIRYSQVKYVDADSHGPAGLQFTAVVGHQFPKDAISAQPLLFPVLSVNADLTQMEVMVPSASSFPPGPCDVKLKSADGTSVTTSTYSTSALLPLKADGKVRLLLVAQSSSAFPRMPAFAEPDCKPAPYQPHPLRPVLFLIKTDSSAILPGVTTSSVQVEANHSDGFVRAGGYAKVYGAEGDVKQLPYTSALQRDGAVTLMLPRGVAVQGDAVYIAPESARVLSVSADGSMVQIAAPNDGSFSPGPGVLHARRPNGREKRVRYEKLALLLHGAAAGGFLLTAAKGEKFPRDIVRVRPCAEGRPLPSRVLAVDGVDGNCSITIKPSSAFPVRGAAHISLLDGTRVHMEYVSSRLSAAAFSVAQPDGSSVIVPASHVQRVPPQAEVTTPDGTRHTVGLSAVSPKKVDPGKTQVLVTLPDGREARVPETAVHTETGPHKMLRIVLGDGQRVEVPAADVLPVKRTCLVKVAGRPGIEVPAERVCPCQCAISLEECKCACGDAASNCEHRDADKFKVELPDGSAINVLPDEVSQGDAGPGSRLQIALPGGGHVTVAAANVERHVHGIPDGMARVRLPGGSAQIISETRITKAEPEPLRYQVLLPEGIYSVVSATQVCSAARPVTVTLADGRVVSVPRGNVHKPTPELRVSLAGGRTIDTPPSAVTFSEAHLRVLMPDGNTVALAVSRVSEAPASDGAPAELVLEAAHGSACPADAAYVAPAETVPLQVLRSSPDGRRLMVVAPPDALPNVLSRVRVIQANGRTSEIDYARAYVLARDAAGPFVAVEGVAPDGAFMEVQAPAALPSGPVRLRALLKDGTQVEVMSTGMVATGAGLLRLIAQPGAPFPREVVQVAVEGPRRVLLTARRGQEFPPRAVGLVPLRDVQPSFSVVQVVTRGTRMRVDARDDGTFPQGPGVMRVRVRGGKQVLVAYDTVAVCLPDLVGPGGLVFTAPEGVSFPEGAEMVEATGGNRGASCVAFRQGSLVRLGENPHGHRGASVIGSSSPCV